MTTLAAELAAFKSERIATAAAAIGNRNVLTVVAVWVNHPTMDWRRPRRARPTDARERWDWIWSGLVVDFEALAAASGLAVDDVIHAFNLARSLRMVFPDGTISDSAAALLYRRMERELGSKGDKPDPDEPEGKDGDE